MHAVQTGVARKKRTSGGRVQALEAIAPWVLVLVITGLFQIFRDAPVDGVIFLVPAALLIADAAGLMRVILSGLAFRPRPATVVVAAVIAGALLIFGRRHGPGDGIVLVALGLFLLSNIWPNAFGTQSTDSARLIPGITRARGIRHAAIAWGCVAVACCLWEVANFYQGMPSAAAEAAHPTISDLFDPVLSNMFGRGAFVVIWLIIGVTLLRRGRRP